MHPEAAVGVDVFEAVGAEGFVDAFDGPGDVFGGFDDRGFDVDEAEADADGGLDVLESLQFLITAAGEFEQDVIDVQGVDEVDEQVIASFLNRLSAIVSEAHVQGGLVGDDVEDTVEGFGGPFGVGGVSGKDFLVDLNHFGVDVADLGGEDVAEGVDEGFLGFVVAVEQDAAEHIGAGDGEFERARGKCAGALEVLLEVEGPFADLSFNDSWRLGCGI